MLPNDFADHPSRMWDESNGNFSWRQSHGLEDLPPNDNVGLLRNSTLTEVDFPSAHLVQENDCVSQEESTYLFTIYVVFGLISLLTLWLILKMLGLW